jgi:hypothetical protein
MQRTVDTKLLGVGKKTKGQINVFPRMKHIATTRLCAAAPTFCLFLDAVLCEALHLPPWKNCRVFSQFFFSLLRRYCSLRGLISQCLSLR